MQAVFRANRSLHDLAIYLRFLWSYRERQQGDMERKRASFIESLRHWIGRDNSKTSA